MKLWSDFIYLLKRYKKYDPSATSYLEVLFLYPGVRILFFYRVASFLFHRKIPFFPKFLCEIGRFLTGIDIHPGAKIGRGLIIDHGMGVVIGGTSIIGNDVIMFHGVTLGAVKFDHEKRHPTIGDNVFIGAGAKILGNITVGKAASVGANAVVLIDIPPYTTAVGVPAKVSTTKSFSKITTIERMDSEKKRQAA